MTTSRTADANHSFGDPPATSSKPQPLGGGGGAIPITFGPRETTCVGWFHPSSSQARGAGVVICPPIGYEGNCAHETCRELAERLARAGFAVLRFDYHGTGDSPGGDASPARVQAWQDSLKFAIEEVRRLGAMSPVSLIGIRLGATLAVNVAAVEGAIDNLVLWAPCVSGRAFARELRMAAGARRERLEHGDLETMGYLYTAKTLEHLQSIDLLRLTTRPAKRALLIGRDDLREEGPLPNALKKLGVDVASRQLQGFAAMMVEPRERDVAGDTLEAITEWLSEAYPPSSAETPKVGPPSLGPPRPAFIEGVRETPIAFGLARNLFGIFSEPADHPRGARARVGVLMLSVGTNHHVGPNRMYVKLARAMGASGYRSLRFDLAGIGDSHPATASPPGPRMYSKSAVGDVQQAMEWLSRRGCEQFVLVGLCSGAYVAFQTALADRRVSGQVLMNPRRLAWRPGDTLESVMRQSFKSTCFYKRALLEPSTYVRLARGKIDARGIANRLRLLAMAHARRYANRAFRQSPHEEDVLLNLRMICARGTDSLFIVGSEDDGLDYLEFHLGPRGRKLRDVTNFRMVFVEDTDHTFSRRGSLERATDALLDYLDSRYADGSAGRAPLPSRIE